MSKLELTGNHMPTDLFGNPIKAGKGLSLLQMVRRACVLPGADRFFVRMAESAMLRRSIAFQKIMQRIKIDPAITFEGTPCWQWTGPTSGEGRGGGYPRMCLDGQTVAVHRVMYINTFGYVPGKKQIDHKCRNRCCVNPAHLEKVTHKQNQKRRAAAGGAT